MLTPPTPTTIKPTPYSSSEVNTLNVHPQVFISSDILDADDLYELQELGCSAGLSIQYQLTQAELGWLKFVKGRYAIADYISSNMTESGVLTINAYQLTEAMEADCGGAGKAVMLSDGTALQRICFWLYSPD